MANFLDMLSQGMAIANADGVIQYANPVAMESVGFKPGSKLAGAVLTASARVIAAERDEKVELPPMEVAGKPVRVSMLLIKGPRPHTAAILISVLPDSVKSVIPESVPLVEDAPKPADASRHEDAAVSLQNLMTVIRHDMQDPLNFLSFEFKTALADLGQERSAELIGKLESVTATVSRLVEMAPLWGESPFLKDDRIVVQALVEEAWDMVADRARLKRVAVKVSGTPAEDIAPVYGSRVWLRRVLAETLRAAITGANDGATLEIRERQSGQYVTFNIINHGLSPFEKPGVKSLPYRKDVRDGGTPPVEVHEYLGMIMCRRIVEMHGGKIMKGTEDDPDQWVIQLPTGAPTWQTTDAQIAIQQAEQYARDISLMMTRSRKKQAVKESN